MDEPKKTEAHKFAEDLTDDARTFAMLAHLLGAVLGFLGPLVIWIVKKEEHPFVEDQAREALNFHLTLLIAYAGLIVVFFATCGFGVVLYPVVFVGQIVFGILGAVQANGGEYYRYPVTIRMVH
jgi:uncharacterized Tic20 family protein